MTKTGIATPYDSHPTGQAFALFAFGELAMTKPCAVIASVSEAISWYAKRPTLDAIR
jgi:hypothetical protein